MTYSIEYYDNDVISFLLAQPAHLQANFIHITNRMMRYGITMADTSHRHYDEVFELHFFEPNGLNRVIFMAQIDKKIIMLHIVVQKTLFMPWKEKGKAAQRMKELKFG